MPRSRARSALSSSIVGSPPKSGAASATICVAMVGTSSTPVLRPGADTRIWVTARATMAYGPLGGSSSGARIGMAVEVRMWLRVLPRNFGDEFSLQRSNLVVVKSDFTPEGHNPQCVSAPFPRIEGCVKRSLGAKRQRTVAVFDLPDLCRCTASAIARSAVAVGTPESDHGATFSMFYSESRQDH